MLADVYKRQVLCHPFPGIGIEDFDRGSGQGNDLPSFRVLLLEFKPGSKGGVVQNEIILLYELFPGAPVVKGGYAYVSDKPGLGIEMIEEKCKKYPCKNVRIKRLELRYPDGSVQMP